MSVAKSISIDIFSIDIMLAPVLGCPVDQVVLSSVGWVRGGGGGWGHKLPAVLHTVDQLQTQDVGNIYILYYKSIHNLQE